MQRSAHANQVITYTFDTLVELPIRAHVSTRHGGVSPAPWNTLNFSVLRGDEPERVQANRERFAAAGGVNVDEIVTCQQVHGTGIAKVDWADAGQRMEGSDGLITDAVGLPLALVFADCAPLLLYDRRNHALGVSHSGWRGTVNGIPTATLWAMQAAYDTDPADVIAAIGPSIGPESYEVGQEVLDLTHAKLDFADTLFTYPNGDDRNPYFNLWQAIRGQLTAAGVPAEQVEVSGIDTARNTQDFFSHRAEKGRCGLFSMMAWLTSK